MTDDRKHEGGKRPPRGPRRDQRQPASGASASGKPFRKRDEDAPRGGKPPRKPRPFAKDAPRGGAAKDRPPHREGQRPPSGPRPDSASDNRGEERIAKRLARAGVASRRDAEEMIAAGRVRVNGEILSSPARNVGPGDRIEIDGAEIPAIERTRLFLFHKPAGVVTTNKDPEGRRTVFDVLPAGLPRLMTVGRLDINTEGLLLLTNDGGLARALELPSTGWLRRYRVRVHGKVEPQALEGLKEGIAVDGVLYGAIEATLDREQGSNAWITIGLREGKNREVKNVLGALGLDVTRLIRVSYGPFQLADLGDGEIRELRGKHLRDQLGEKLIADAGADFEAPVVKEFSNKPVSAKKQRDEAAPARPARKPDRQDRRDQALDRLDTRRPGKPDEAKKQRRDEPQRSRTSNVWMAPGARAVGPKKAAERAADTEGRRYAGKPKPKSPSGRPGAKGPPRGRPDRRK